METLKARLDRYEEEYAVFITETDDIINVKKSELDIKPGEREYVTLTLDCGRFVSCEILKDENEAARKRAEYLWEKLRRKKDKR